MIEIKVKTEDFTLKYQQEDLDIAKIGRLLKALEPLKPVGRTVTTMASVTPQAEPQYKGLPEKNKPETKLENKPETIVESRKWFEPGEEVKVDISCPGCGFNKVINGHFGNYYTKCLSCKTKLYNEPSTDLGFGHLDNKGCIYKADSVYFTREEREEFQRAFGEGEDKCTSN